MKRNSTKTSDALLIGYDCSNGKDHAMLIVGRKQNKKPVEVINAFQGEEAESIYNMLITVKGGKNERSRGL